MAPGLETKGGEPKRPVGLPPGGPSGKRKKYRGGYCPCYAVLWRLAPQSPKGGEQRRHAQELRVLKVLAGSAAAREGRRTAREEPRPRKGRGRYLPREADPAPGGPSKRKQATMGKTGPKESPSHPG